MITKQLVKNYKIRKCPYMTYLLSNEKTALEVYLKALEAGLDELGIDEEDDEGNSIQDRLFELLKDNKQLLLDIKAKLDDNNASLAEKIILNMKDLQEISLLSQKYFILKYQSKGKVVRADTIDGSLMGVPLFDQEKIKANTQKYLEDKSVKVILEGQIDNNEYRARWDALIKNNDGTYDIAEVKGSGNVFKNESETIIKDNYRIDIMFQYHVYKDFFGKKLSNIKLIKMNREFEFKEGEAEYPLNDESILDLFEEVPDIKTKEGDYISLLTYIQDNEKELNELLEDIKVILSKGKEPTPCMKYNCRPDGKCELFADCLKADGYPKENSIFVLTNDGKLGGYHGNTKKLMESGVKTIKDITNEQAEELYPTCKKSNGKRSAARLQIESVKTNTKEYIYSNEIKEILDRDYKVFPLIFFDFETFQYPVPLVERAHPWEQICSQYSMHVVREGYNLKEHDYDKGVGGGVTHYEFLGNPKVDLYKNPETDLIKTMLDQFAKENVDWKRGKFTLIVYNKSFECTQFKRMAGKYPEYKDFLLMCHDRVVDLLDFFKDATWYKKDFNGRTSLKVVSPAMREDPEIMKDYKDLKFKIRDTLDYHTESDVIYNGAIALDVYQSLLRKALLGHELGEEYDKIRAGLLKYCKKDSWGTVILYDILKRHSM